MKIVVTCSELGCLHNHPITRELTQVSSELVHICTHPQPSIILGYPECFCESMLLDARGIDGSSLRKIIAPSPCTGCDGDPDRCINCCPLKTNKE